MFEHPYGVLSLLPPVVAIVLAIVTRRVVPSLLLGVLVGAWLVEPNWNPLRGLADALETHLWGSINDEDHLRVFAFTSLMGSMVAVIHHSGGMHGVVEKLKPLARTRRGGQLITWALGLVVFFDDYANSLLLGGTMRPLTDRLKISREKLSFLVDSTAAPVSGLAIVSTWVAGEIGFIERGLEGLDFGGVQVDGFSLFLETIPYRFYVLWMLLFVPLVALLGRDFGSMLQAERRAAAGNEQVRTVAGMRAELPAPEPDVPHRWQNALVPVLVLLGVVVWLLLVTGGAKLRDEGVADVTWFDRFSQGDSYLALLYGSLAGLLTAAFMARAQRLLTLDQLRSSSFEGARHVSPALVILWLAWALSGLTDEEYLGTGQYLGGLLQQSVSIHWMPTIVYLLSSFVAFATGTSWGTMGILMPLVVRVTWQMLAADGSPVSPADPLLVATIGSVLAGAIFGDHCSPISDTTVLSSQASGCDHIAHVRTQMPYAIFVSTVSVLCGTLPVGYGVPVWPLLPLGLAVLALGLWLLGRRSVEAAL